MITRDMTNKIVVPNNYCQSRLNLFPGGGGISVLELNADMANHMAILDISYSYIRYGTNNCIISICDHERLAELKLAFPLIQISDLRRKQKKFKHLNILIHDSNRI